MSVFKSVIESSSVLSSSHALKTELLSLNKGQQWFFIGKAYALEFLIVQPVERVFLTIKYIEVWNECDRNEIPSDGQETIKINSKFQRNRQQLSENINLLRDRKRIKVDDDFLDNQHYFTYC